MDDNIIFNQIKYLMEILKNNLFFRVVLTIFIVILTLTFLGALFETDDVYFYSNYNGKKIELDEDQYELFLNKKNNEDFVYSQLEGKEIKIYYTDIYERDATFIEQIMINFGKKEYWGMTVLITLIYVYFFKRNFIQNNNE